MRYEIKCRKLHDSICWTRLARMNGMGNTKEKEFIDNEQQKFTRLNPDLLDYLFFFMAVMASY